MQDDETKPRRDVHYRVTYQCKAEYLPRVLQFMWETERDIYTTIDV
jgi:hypothetical protein